MPILNPQYYTKKFKIEDIEEIGFSAMSVKQSMNDENIVYVYNPFVLYFKLKDGAKERVE